MIWELEYLPEALDDLASIFKFLSTLFTNIFQNLQSFFLFRHRQIIS